jgi:hypothetical protein
VTHHAAPDFWQCYRALPLEVRTLADKAFVLLKADPTHPSLHFKKAGRFWSARVGLHNRALGIEVDDGVLWFWIGSHAQLEAMLNMIDS